MPINENALVSQKSINAAEPVNIHIKSSAEVNSDLVEMMWEWESTADASLPTMAHVLCVDTSVVIVVREQIMMSDKWWH